MVRHKWVVGMRNKLAELAMECDSCAAIEGSKLTRQESDEIQKKLRETIKYIDNKLGL